MDEYIMRSQAIACAIEGADEWGGGYNRYRAELITEAINSIPAQRVKPIKIGHWIIEEKYIDHRIERCSECGFAANRDYIQNYWNYCPHCAADMRGETNG